MLCTPIKSSNRGFTVIELLVVVAIIGLLTGVVWAYVNSGRNKGKDARRLQDIQQISIALELYATASTGSYPGVADTAYVSGTGSCSTGYTQINTVLSATYMSNIPKDPSSTKCYFYIPGANNQSYQVLMAPDDTAWLAKDSGCTSIAAPASSYFCLQR